MPDSLTRQILQEHLVEGDLKPGEPIALKIDQTLLQDATGTIISFMAVYALKAMHFDGGAETMLFLALTLPASVRA